MKWLAIHIDTTHAGLDTLSDFLRHQGIEGLVIEDESDFLDFLENNRQYWDYVDEELNRSMQGKSRITFYVEDSESGYTQVAHVRLGLEGLRQEHPEALPLLMTLDGIEDADWENNWKAFYKPMEIGERLIVIPDWEEAPNHNRVALRLNPGLTFGTGSHPTTRLCLTALERLVKPGMRVLDLGCGSGILSIAALLLGAESAFACDIDEKAVGVAYENAAINHVDVSRYTVRAGDVTGKLRRELGGGYEIVVANIVADVIIALAPHVRSLMAEGGVFLSSGIIDDRGDEVQQVLEANGFRVLERNFSEGWFSFVCE